MKRLEEKLGMPLEDAEACSSFLEKMNMDEAKNKEIYNFLVSESPTNT